MMVVLLAVSSSDTVKEFKRDGAIERVGFVAGQTVLGCCAYSWLGGAFVGSVWDWKVGMCVGSATPLMCMAASAAYSMKVGVKSPGAIASFTGGVDGLLWGYLIENSLISYDVRLPEWATPGIPLTTSLILNAASLAYSQNSRASEGAYVTKTLFAFQSLYYYYQLKRTLLGDYVRYDSTGAPSYSELKFDFTLLPVISVSSALGGFISTAGWEGYTAGDALFLSANISKGSLVFGNVLRTAYLQTFWSQDRWERERDKYFAVLTQGYYYPDNPTMNRLGGASQIVGGILGAGVSYMLIRKHHVPTMAGVLYSVVPAMAYWAAYAPLILFEKDPRPYGSFIPLIQIGLDVGTSYLIYRLFVR